MRARGFVLVVVGVVLGFAAGAHALAGWPALRPALEAGGGDAAAVRAAGIGWHWGSAAMLAFAVLVVLTGRRYLRGDASWRGVALVVGACYALFGAWALWRTGGAPHFLFFLASGLAVALPAR